MKALLLLLDSPICLCTVKNSDLVASSKCLWFWSVIPCNLCPTLTLLGFCLLINATHWSSVCKRSRRILMSARHQFFLSGAWEKYPPGCLPFPEEQYYVYTVLIAGTKNVNQKQKRGNLKAGYLCCCCLWFHLSLVYIIRLAQAATIARRWLRSNTDLSYSVWLSRSWTTATEKL